MVITELTELSGGRYKVFIDGKFAFVLYKGELRLYGVQKEQEIEETVCRKILEEVLPKRAKLRAMNLLQKRQYTQKQLADKLREGYYPEKIIDETITYVASYGYLDDYQYAVDYITYHEASRSRLKIQMDLRQKGIDHEVIRNAFSEWESQGGTQDEKEMIRDALQKKHVSLDCDEKEMRRIYAFLLRKGFSVDNVNSVLATLKF